MERLVQNVEKFSVVRFLRDGDCSGSSSRFCGLVLYQHGCIDMYHHMEVSWAEFIYFLVFAIWRWKEELIHGEHLGGTITPSIHIYAF